jgi:hypothetical protein
LRPHRQKFQSVGKGCCCHWYGGIKPTFRTSESIPLFFYAPRLLHSHSTPWPGAGVECKNEWVLKVALQIQRTLVISRVHRPVRSLSRSPHGARYLQGVSWDRRCSSLATNLRDIKLSVLLIETEFWRTVCFHFWRLSSIND